MIKKILAIAAATVLLAGFIACDADPTRPDTGSFRILLTDKPLDLSTVTAVNVTLSEFQLYPTDGGGPVALQLTEGGEETTLNLLDFQNGAVTMVAFGDVPAVSYQRIRLDVLEASLVHDHDADASTPDVEDPIFLSSGKVDIPVAFNLIGGEEMEVTLDFDAQRSVQVNETNGQNQYIMRPVVVPVGMSSS